MKKYTKKMASAGVNITSSAIKLIAISVAAFLTACATGPSNTATSTAKTDDNCRAQVGQSTDGKEVDVCFPDQGRAWLKNGTFVNVESLRRMNVGMNENQVRELISYPHFNEGFFHPSAWNYVFNFRTGAGSEYITCQYQVQYKDGLSVNMFWNKPGCADVLAPKVTEVARVAPVSSLAEKAGPSAGSPSSASVVAAPERLRLSADALFVFDKSGASDILVDGKVQLDKMVASLKSQYSRIDLITVTGHTDRLGSDVYNQALSTARAATVRDYLIDKGMPKAAVRSYGSGKLQPVAQCDDKIGRKELIACLQPNRRVEIEIMGEKRS